MASTTAYSGEDFHTAGRGVMYCFFGLVVQTFFFGVYTILIWMSTRMLLERSLKTRVNQVMFGITTFMYLLSAAYWAYSVADAVDQMREYIALAVDPFRARFDHTEVTKWSPLFNAITLINCVLSDGVVVWRAWIICRRNHRIYLWITTVFLALTALTVSLTIIFRIANLVVSPIDHLPKDSILAQGVDIFQIATLATSLLSNFTATGVVGATAWGHWQTIRSAFSEEKAGSLRTNRTLLLVVETGVLYCISALAVLPASLIRLPQGTLGDLFTPVYVQIAGAYPTIVLLLVSTNKSLSDSSFHDDKPIHFARNPAVSASGTDTFMSGTDTISDISFARPSTETLDHPHRLSDESSV
ncbi:hypothetical protein DFH08DRAFT_789132 [Mycena albidolilacea]|uniref:Uncharacterized protein n=1 Tax=Mycena albidolilacea TaxID=1033008 RepID=A0AAD6ZGL9_9AGAR|nr:hypothetical protein DFH08DRAFT_789132 [Mycena albidolilacea]